MKVLKFKSVVTVLFLGLIPITAYKCKKSLSEERGAPKISASSKGLSGDYVPLGVPPGSEVYYDGDNGTWTVEMPAGYIYAGYNEEGDYGELKSILNIRCICTKTSGPGDLCSPVSGPIAGCLIGSGCESCDKKTILASDPNFEISGRDGGFINLELGIYPIESKTEATSLPLAFEALFENAAVIEAIKELNEFVYPEGIPEFMANNSLYPPKGYIIVAVNVFGNLAGYPIPETMDHTGIYIDMKQSCLCRQGSGCTEGSKFGLKFCKAEHCTDCEMLSTVIDPRVPID